MRYPASEKLEIIRLVEQSHLPVRRTLTTLGITRAGLVTGTSPETRLEGSSPASQAAIAAFQFVAASALNRRRVEREMR